MTRPLWIRPDRPEPDTCEALNPLISPYADGMASPDEVARVEGHLPSCPVCRQSLLWMQATRRALANRPIVLPPPDLRARIAQAIAASDAAPVSLRPARTFTLRPAYAAAASLSAVAALMVGYGLLHHPAPGVNPVLPPPVTVAVNTPVVRPAVKPLPPKTSVVRHPATHGLLVAQGSRPKVHPAPALVAKAFEDVPTLAPSEAPSERPVPSARSVERDVKTHEALIPNLKPSPRVILKKKPVLSRPLMAILPKPEPADSTPKAGTPDADRHDRTASLPADQNTTVAVHVGTPTVTDEPPRVVVASASGVGHFHTVGLLDAVRTYAVTHQTNAEHNLSLAGRTAVRDAVRTTAFTSGTESSEAYEPLVHP